MYYVWWNDGRDHGESCAEECRSCHELSCWSNRKQSATWMNTSGRRSEFEALLNLELDAAWLPEDSCRWVEIRCGHMSSRTGQSDYESHKPRLQWGCGEQFSKPVPILYEFVGFCFILPSRSCGAKSGNGARRVIGVWSCFRSGFNTCRCRANHRWRSLT